MRGLSIPKSSGARVCLAAAAWLVVVTGLHLYLAGGKHGGTIVRMGYMPVVTNLAAPLVDYVTQGDNLHFEAVKFSSFSDMGQAFRAGAIQAAFIIAPLAIMLFKQGTPLKVVYIGNRNESTLVVRTGAGIKTPTDLAGRTIAVPIRYSGHFLALRRYLREHRVDKSSVNIVEVAPPDMAAALASGQIDGYFVGEPFASKAIASGIGKRFFDVESTWPKFICNVLIVRTELIRSHPERVQELVATAARSGAWAKTHVDEVARIVSPYWGMDSRDIAYAFSHPPGRFCFDLYVPVAGELNAMAREMGKDGLLPGGTEVGAMVEDRFAKAARQYFAGPVDNLSSIKWRPGTGLGMQAAQ